MTDDEKKALADAVCQAASSHAVAHSVALVNFADSANPSLGSGTCIKIGDRYLVGTAGHNFDGVTTDQQIVLVPPHRWSNEWLPYTARNHCGRPVDVGWIEIPETSARALGRDFLSIDRLELGQNHFPDDWCLVQGYPAGLIDRALLGACRLQIAGMGFMTDTVEPGQWPTDVSPPLDRSRDVLLDYIEVGRRSDTGENVNLPNAYGLSGGSVLRVTPPFDSDLWVPGKVHLVAIERGFLETGRTLTATQIHLWLRLVYEDFADLREVIGPRLEPLGVL